MAKTKLWLIFIGGVLVGHILTRAFSLFRVFTPALLLVAVVLVVWMIYRRRPRKTRQL